jgi:hypothetical protein
MQSAFGHNRTSFESVNTGFAWHRFFASLGTQAIPPTPAEPGCPIVNHAGKVTVPSATCLLLDLAIRDSAATVSSVDFAGQPVVCAFFLTVVEMKCAAGRFNSTDPYLVL